MVGLCSARLKYLVYLVCFLWYLVILEYIEYLLEHYVLYYDMNMYSVV